MLCAAADDSLAPALTRALERDASKTLAPLRRRRPTASLMDLPVRISRCKYVHSAPDSLPGLYDRVHHAANLYVGRAARPRARRPCAVELQQPATTHRRLARPIEDIPWFLVPRRLPHWQTRGAASSCLYLVHSAAESDGKSGSSTCTMLVPRRAEPTRTCRGARHAHTLDTRPPVG